jgi:hypothetical protein
MTGAPSSDGKFSLFYKKGYAFLVVQPPAGSGRPVYPEQIENRMKILRIPPVSGKAIREIIQEAKGEPIQLIEWPDGSGLTLSVGVKISDDLMSAWITLEAPKKSAASPLPEDILESLNNHGVVYGIDIPGIERLLARKDYGRSVLVARGVPPVRGEKGRVAYHFNPNRGRPYLEMDYGRINLKELNFIENKKKDDLLAEILSPVQATEGRTVTGAIIPAETDMDEVVLKAGENTRIGPEKTRLYAECDGNVKIEKGRIVIEPVITVENVNYETGNIRFDGSVVVNGSIADGFVIEASGDIQVGKGVGRSSLKAGGNVLLKTGVNGNGEGAIDCGGNLFAKYIESTKVFCRGNVFVEEAVMNSTLTVFQNFILNGRRSEIIGGDIIVGGSLWCKKLGNIYEVSTRAAIGVNPEHLLAFRSAKKNLDTRQEELNKVEEKVEQFEKAILEGRGDERVLLARDQLRESAATLTGEITVLRHKVPGLREGLHPSKGCILVVEDTLFKGVTLFFGNLEYRVPDNGVRKTILKAGEGEILESGYNYHDKPKIRFDEAREA